MVHGGGLVEALINHLATLFLNSEHAIHCSKLFHLRPKKCKLKAENEFVRSTVCAL